MIRDVASAEGSIASAGRTSNDSSAPLSVPNGGSGPLTLAVNGRYRRRRATGVERYAHEIAARLNADLHFVEPSERANRGLTGHAWEQVALPWRLRGRLLWSPCNTGPLAVARQVVTLHDCAFVDCAESFSPAFARWYRFLMPRLLRRVRSVLTVSEFSKRRIVELFGLDPDRVDAVYNGVDPRFAPRSAERIAELRARLSLPQQYVLCVGSLTPRKNLQRLLRAWATIAPRVPEFGLVLAGAVDPKLYAALDLPADVPRVAQTGYVADDDLPALYAGAAVFAYPSLYEGFGLPVLEAMACGTPVVSSNATSLPEVAGDAAELVDPLSVEAMADALLRLLENAGRRSELSAAGLRRAAAFTWDRAAAQTRTILERAAQ